MHVTKLVVLFLSQIHDGIDRPVTYISRTFKKSEKNKPIIEKELLAIHFAVTVLRPYLYGNEFTVYSDHKPLLYLYKMKNPTSRLTRIRLELEEYKFNIVHIPGKDNVVADALSRINIEDVKNMYNYDILAITRSMAKSNKFEQEAHSNNNVMVDQIEVPRVCEKTQSGLKRGVIRAALTQFRKNASK